MHDYKTRPDEPLPDLVEMRADMVEADEDWSGDDEFLVAAWCDLFEVPAEHPQFRAL